jgi:ABC-2 type transport system ATP-binding protein
VSVADRPTAIPENSVVFRMPPPEAEPDLDGVGASRDKPKPVFRRGDEEALEKARVAGAGHGPPVLSPRVPRDRARHAPNGVGGRVQILVPELQVESVRSPRPMGPEERPVSTPGRFPPVNLSKQRAREPSTDPGRHREDVGYADDRLTPGLTSEIEEEGFHPGKDLTVLHGVHPPIVGRGVPPPLEAADEGEVLRRIPVTQREGRQLRKEGRGQPVEVVDPHVCDPADRESPFLNAMARGASGPRRINVTDYAIRTHGLTKRYGSFTAVDHVDLQVPSGTVFGLLGPNGAGKTTIIKLLTGLTDLTEGEATVAGFDVRRSPMHVKKTVGWVAAEVILDDDLSARENLWLQAQLQRLDDWSDRADALLRYFDLTDRSRHKVSTFSTGMRKKLEIALALLHQPKVIFMDEPTIGLDPGTRQMLWELIQGVHREFGVTVLLTTHYIAEADALCDNVAIIDHGKIVATGTPDELKAKERADVIEMETTRPVDEARLRAIPGVLEVRSQGKSWLIRVSSAEEVLPGVLDLARDAGIRSIEVQKPSLETVFLKLTGRRIGSDAGEPVDFRKFYAQMRRARS